MLTLDVIYKDKRLYIMVHRNNIEKAIIRAN